MEPNPQNPSPLTPNQNPTPNITPPPAEPAPVAQPAAPVVTPTNPVPPVQTQAPAVTPIAHRPNPGSTSGTGPSIYVGGDSGESQTPLQPLQPFSSVAKPKRSIPKKPLLAGLAVLLIAGGAAAYQFGYKTNPSLVYSQSLSNTGKGYDALVNYLDKQSSADYAGVLGSGDYKFKSSGSTTDGSFKFASDGEDSLTLADIGLGVSRANLEVRSIKEKGKSPDYYIKAAGINGLDSLVGSDVAAAAAKLNDKWIVIDHTLIDNFSRQLSSEGTADTGTTPSKEQIMDEVRAFGKVNQDYIFASDDKAVMKRQGEAKSETVDGHKTIHYKVSVDKANLKKYLTAQHDALLASKLGEWIKKNKYEDSVKSTYEQMLKSADGVKESDMFDLWSDVDSRLIYKIRVPQENSTTDYSELGLDYKGGDEYPFFIGAADKTNNFTLRFTLNSKSNQMDGKMSVKSTGDESGEFSANFTFKPTEKRPQIDAPSGAMQLAEAMQLVGLGDLYDIYSNPSTFSEVNAGVQQGATDTERKVDINALRTQLEGAYAQNGNYPSLAELNDANWRNFNMSGIDTEALKDPEGSGTKLVATAQPHIYAYTVSTEGGKSCESTPKDCQVYKLTATLSDGTTYTKESLSF